MRPLKQKQIDEWTKLYGPEFAQRHVNEYQERYSKFLESLNKKRISDDKTPVKNYNEYRKKVKQERKIRKKRAKYRKEQRKERKDTKRISIELLRQKLEENPPKSEKWFRELFEAHDLKHADDEYNQIYKNIYIPDIINLKYRYIIEIDGSIHNLTEVQKKDAYKNMYFKKQGFKVLRIKAFSVKEYIDTMRLILFIRGVVDYPAKFKEFCLQYRL